jgi:hypothetical protein
MSEAIELALVEGDLSRLTPAERLGYFRQVCESMGLNPLTKPLEYLRLNGKLVLYATKNATDQLRSLRKVSVVITSREIVDDLVVVTARASLPDGRTDESIGAIPIAGLRGEAKANALMKCETKARRRATLALCGLSVLDESELDTIPGAVREPMPVLESQGTPVAALPAPAEPTPEPEPKSAPRAVEPPPTGKPGRVAKPGKAKAQEPAQAPATVDWTAPPSSTDPEDDDPEREAIQAESGPPSTSSADPFQELCDWADRITTAVELDKCTKHARAMNLSPELKKRFAPHFTAARDRVHAKGAA